MTTSHSTFADAFGDESSEPSDGTRSTEVVVPALSDDKQSITFGPRVLKLAEMPTYSLILEENQPALDGYLASALTSLGSGSERERIELLSQRAKTICANNRINLYLPSSVSDPVHNSEISPREVFNLDRNRVGTSDLLIYLTDYPSTGSGQELTFAVNNLIPVILLIPDRVRVSRMVLGLPGTVCAITYKDMDQMADALDSQLRLLKPLLYQRRLAFGEFPNGIIAERVKQARTHGGLTVEQLCEANSVLTPDIVRGIESGTELSSSVTLAQLRMLAIALDVPVSMLIEPDLLLLANQFVKSHMTMAARSGASTEVQAEMFKTASEYVTLFLRKFQESDAFKEGYNDDTDEGNDRGSTGSEL